MYYKFTANISLARTCYVEADSLEEARELADQEEWEMEGEELIEGMFYQESEDEDSVDDSDTYELAP